MPHRPLAPAPSSVQSPSAVAPSEARHTVHPVPQAELQQTPSAQCVEAQSAPSLQGSPSARGTRHVPAVQTPDWHWLGAAQGLPSVRLAAQVPPAQ